MYNITLCNRISLDVLYVVMVVMHGSTIFLESQQKTLMPPHSNSCSHGSKDFVQYRYSYALQCMDTNY